MKIDIRIPSVGESVREAVLAQWMKASGDRVRKGETILVIETDKVTLELSAEADGVLSILVKEGQTVPIGAVVGTIDTEAAPVVSVERQSLPSAETAATDHDVSEPAKDASKSSSIVLMPSVRRLLEETGIEPERIAASGPAGRITPADVLLFLDEHPQRKQPKLPPSQPQPTQQTVERPSTDISPSVTSLPASEAPQADVIRKPMSPIRKRIAERLLEARRNTAMLTTFNEIDMSRVAALRAEHREAFQKRHGVALGMMSFFVKACVVALKEIPELNASIEGQDIVYHRACHIGVAVGSERGLVVPVIRNAEALSFAAIERAIVDFVKAIQENRLELSALEGGTFTITNGGVFGSLMSTPILNPPQSGILGMHKIEKRPVVIDDTVVIRPMMYVALSYDHRIVDGKGAVTFLKRVKECVEQPERMFLEV
ncbi:MAG: 2-oxoglutarate dehydrogenase complex dihydrolipoyllysine-residue succinyltransferase [Thermodesulfobacteriota bacterium]